ncbi:hypothetical protein [Streptomyces sp. NPDC060035]
MLPAWRILAPGPGRPPVGVGFEETDPLPAVDAISDHSDFPGQRVAR